MAKFTKEHKEEMGSNYFKPGVHKVKIEKVEFGKTQDDKEFAEFSVVGENGEEGQARVWFTTDKAINFSFNIIRGIFVHNAPENKKDEMRKKVDACKDTNELSVICVALSGKECWYSVFENPERTFTGKDGQLRNSFDRNVYGYEPKPRDSQPSKKSDKVEIEDVPDDAGKGEPFGF